MKEQYITRKNYDLTSGEIGRILRTLVCAKVVPLGNLGGGARLKGLLVLLFSHALGRFLFPLLVPFEDRLHRLYQRLRRR